MNLKISSLIIVCIVTFFTTVESKGQTTEKQKAVESKVSITEFSFCDVVKRPEDFEGKLIKMSVLYQEALIGDILLTAPACEDTYMDFVINHEDETSYKVVREKIDKNMQFDEKNKSYGEARITVSGVLEKNKYKGYRPVKNFLQNYTFRIDEVIDSDCINKK